MYSLHPGVNAEFSTHVYRYAYESLTTPDSVFDYDVRSKARTLVKQIEVLGGYDRSDY